MSSGQVAATVGGILQLGGVVAVAVDVIDVRRALGQQHPLRVAWARVQHAAGAPRRLAVAAWRRLRPRPPVAPQVVALEGVIAATSAAHATVRAQGPTDADTLRELWRIVVQEHDSELRALRADLTSEIAARNHDAERVRQDIDAAVADVHGTVHQAIGTHHGRRLAFALMIAIGLALSIASVWLPGAAPAAP